MHCVQKLFQGISVFFQIKCTYFRGCLMEANAAVCYRLQIEMLLKNRPFFIEVKYDGERMQLHKRDGEFKYFSRGSGMLVLVV